MVREGGAIDVDWREAVTNPRRKEWLTIAFELRVTMTDEENLKWAIDNVREGISRDLAKLASKNLIADRRKAIREHLNICHSTLKSLKELVGRNRAASQKSKLEQHESLQRQLPLNKAQVGRL